MGFSPLLMHLSKWTTKKKTMNLNRKTTMNPKKIRSNPKKSQVIDLSLHSAHHCLFVSGPRTNESSRDVREQRTLFVRNVPFDATEDELANILSSNNERRISSCRLVIDRISKHPRGSAFVQFVSAEDAEACLKSSFTLRGQNLYADMALGRGELVQAKEIREKTYEDNRKQDQRNLSLAKYGVILDLKELDGDENDLRKRQQLEDVKKQKLKDPIHFISTTRLTVHNLPKTVDDAQLRKLVLQRLKDAQIPMKDVVLNECRVMKTNKDTKKSLGEFSLC